MITTLRRSPGEGQDRKASQPAAVPSRVVVDELRKLLQHSSHYLAGILASLGLGFISFPIFTRLFSVSDYGTIDLIAKVLLLLVAFSKLGLQQSALRFYDGRLFASDRLAARRYYSTMLLSMVLSATCVMVLFWVVVGVSPKSLISRSLAVLLCLASVLILVRALTSLFWVFLRVQEKTKFYSVFTVTTKAVSVLAICLSILWFGRSVLAFYSGTIVVELAVAVVLSFILLRGGLVDIRSFDSTLLRTGLAFGLPLICYELASIILDAGDRVLVRHYLGANTLGFYSLAYGMSDYVNNLLIVPINLALAPIYLRLWMTEGQASTSEFLSSGFDIFIMISVGIFAVVAATAHDAVTLFASSKYHGAEALIPTLVAGLLVYTSHSFLSAGLMIHKNTRTMAKLLAYSALFNIGLNCLLLPRIGVQAAAIATLLSYLFCVVLLARASFKLLPLRIDVRAIARYGLGGIIAWYVASRIGFSSSLANLVARSVVAVILYSGLVYAADSRVRALPGHLLGRQSHHAELPPLTATEG